MGTAARSGAVHQGLAAAPLTRGRIRKGPLVTSLAPLLQGFFTTRLISQRRSSPHTIASYRDTFRLLLTFAWQHKGIEPSQLDLDHLDADLITPFLQHLKTARGNSTQTRNARLAAIRSMFRYAALQAPEHAATIQRVLAIPGQSADHPLICFLTSGESEAVLGACDQSTWIGRRDRAGQRSRPAPPACGRPGGQPRPWRGGRTAIRRTPPRPARPG